MEYASVDNMTGYCKMHYDDDAEQHCRPSLLLNYIVMHDNKQHVHA